MSYDAVTYPVRLALRGLVRAPGFSLGVMLLMALGIGANAAVFTALDQAVFRPLPYRDPARLVMVWEDFSPFGVPKQRVSPQTFLDWRTLNHTFDALAAYGLDARTLSGNGEPEEVNGARVTANLIPLLGVSPLLGRTITPEEEGLSPGPVVIGYRLWKGRYGADPGIIGRNILMNHEPHEVIGIMPPGFDFPSRGTDYWLPLGLSPQTLSRRNSHFLRVIGRLAPGHQPSDAQVDMTSVAAQLARAFPTTNARVGATVVPLKDDIVGDTRTAFIILIAATACVLLIACGNVGHLVLARAAARRGDVAVRVAIGASPVRVFSEILLEGMLLAGGGAVAGLVLAQWSLATLQRMIPAAIAGFVTLRMDLRVLAFTIGASILSGILFGLAPALQLSRTVLLDTRGTIGHGPRRIRNALVVAEVALALALIVAAGLLIQTLWRLRAIDPGFKSDSILTAGVSVALPKYEAQERRTRFYTDVLARVRAIPGVTAAGLTSDLPYTSRGNTMSLAIEGRPAAPGAVQDALFRLVSSGYLQTIGAALVEGRLLDDGDRADSTPVVVINETMARQYWPGESPLGRHVDTGTGGGTTRWMTVVGVIADVRERGLDVAMKPAVYVPFPQTAITFFQPSELAVRTTREPLTIAKEVQDAVWSVDPEQPVANVRTMNDIVDGELANRAQMLQLLGAFAVLAIVLTAFGVYAVLSFLVTQSTREIGLRLALGAQREDIVHGMLGYIVRLTFVGIVAGTAIGVAATRLLSSLLYGVTPLDWRTFASVAVLVAVVALLASYLPTRRAALVDPIIALRDI